MKLGDLPRQQRLLQKKDIQDIAVRIEHWRQYSGLAQNELARLVYVAPSSVHGWIRGKFPPSYPILPRLARALGVSLAEFFGPLPTLPG